MKLALSLSLLMVACIEIIDYTVARDEMTFKVTSMIGYENSYLQLKRRNPALGHPREEKLRHKEHVCSAILADAFFDVHNVEMVNPNHKTIYKQVKQNHADIHDEHFIKSVEDIRGPKFANPYRPRKINVRGEIAREYTFTCLVKNNTAKNLQQYFVSPEYSVQEGSTSKTVRFLFAYNNKKEVVVVAKAEKNSSSHKTETASTKAAKSSERSYEKSSYQESSDEESYEEEDDDSDSSW